MYVLTGELVLMEDDGETVLKAGESAAWQAGVRNGHHLVNRSSRGVRRIFAQGRYAVS